MSVTYHIVIYKNKNNRFAAKMRLYIVIPGHKTVMGFILFYETFRLSITGYPMEFDPLIPFSSTQQLCKIIRNGFKHNMKWVSLFKHMTEPSFVWEDVKHALDSLPSLRIPG